MKKEDIQRLWLDAKDSRRKFQWIFPVLGIIVGLGVTLFLVFDGWKSVPQHQYCSVLDEDFSSGILDPNIWTQEVEVGGFGYVLEHSQCLQGSIRQAADNIAATVNLT